MVSDGKGEIICQFRYILFLTIVTVRAGMVMTVLYSSVSWLLGCGWSAAVRQDIFSCTFFYNKLSDDRRVPKSVNGLAEIKYHEMTNSQTHSVHNYHSYALKLIRSFHSLLQQMKRKLRFLVVVFHYCSVRRGRGGGSQHDDNVFNNMSVLWYIHAFKNNTSRTSCLVARVKFTQFTATILSFIPILPSIAAAPFGLMVLTKIPPKSGPPC